MSLPFGVQHCYTCCWTACISLLLAEDLRKSGRCRALPGAGSAVSMGAAVQAAADDVRALVGQERVLESTMHLGCLRERREAGAAAATSKF